MSALSSSSSCFTFAPPWFRFSRCPSPSRGVHPDVLPQCQFEHHVAGRTGAGHWRSRRCGHCHGRERIPASRRSAAEAGRSGEAARSRILIGAAKQVGPALFLLARHHCCFVPARLPARSAGRPHVPAARLDKDAGPRVFFPALHHARAGADAVCSSAASFGRNRETPLRASRKLFTCRSCDWCLRHWKLVVALNLVFLAVTIPLYFRLGSQFMPRALRRLIPLYAERSAGNLHRRRRRRCSCRSRTASSARFLKLTTSSEPSAAPTARPTMRRSTCTTPRSC